MIDTIYLDMDGVICDFRKKCEDLDCIQGTKIDWKVVHENGPEFWSEMEWTKNGRPFYKWLKRLCDEEDIDLYILSSVNFTDGKIGKIDWLKKNTSFDMHHILIVPFGKDKAMYASETSLLIDDFGKNCQQFSSIKNAKAVKFVSAMQARKDVLAALEEKD